MHLGDPELSCDLRLRQLLIETQSNQSLLTNGQPPDRDAESVLVVHHGELRVFPAEKPENRQVLTVIIDYRINRANQVSARSSLSLPDKFYRHARLPGELVLAGTPAQALRQLLIPHRQLAGK